MRANQILRFASCNVLWPTVGVGTVPKPKKKLFMPAVSTIRFLSSLGEEGTPTMSDSAFRMLLVLRPVTRTDSPR